MKKLLLFATATLAAFVSCSKDTTHDLTPATIPYKLHVSIAEDESRMQLSDEKTVWTEGDKVSVFYKSDANQCWKFDGKTGDRSGTLSCISQGMATTQMDKVVVVYPYNESYKITPSSGNIEATLPAVQKYLQSSYGLESSPMISSGYYTQFALKNVCGWLKLQLSGTGRVTKISFKGNNGEQLAGSMYINADDATVTLISASVDNDENQETGGTLIFEDSIVREVVLDCADGVELNDTDAVPFYIALPPTVFEYGFTATLHFDNGMQKEISTSKRVEITRNHIVPMGKVDSIVPAIPNNQIWYTSTNGKIVEPFKTDGFGANIISNTYENGKGVIVFDGKVTSIGDYAFHGRGLMTSITIPDSVTSIGDDAFFGCHRLTSMNIHDNIVSIGDSAFANCNYLVSFSGKYSTSDSRCLVIDGKLIAFAPAGLIDYNIPDCITSIGVSAFRSCINLKTINIPNSVTSIEELAFSNSSLTNVVIPDSVISIGDMAFNNCKSLTSITIPDSVTSIGGNAFYRCTGECIINCNIPDNVFYKSDFTEIIIGNSVTSIGVSAFYECSSLTSITIPDSVISIGDYVFANCSSLTGVTIPDSVTTIGYGVFWGCSSLVSFSGKYTTADSRCLVIDGKLIAFAPSGLTEYVIPDNVTTIGDFAFSGCSCLTSVTIPNSVTTIGDSAFGECGSLTSVTIPDSVTSIGDFAFSGCSCLTSVTIPDSVTSIGNYAFNSSSLTSVYITDIAKWCTIKFSSSTAYAYNLYLNGELVTDLLTPDSVTSIGDFAFDGCSSLTSITIPNSVTTIGYSAFRSCNSLISITIPNSVTSIGDYAFYCNSLTSVYCKATTPPHIETYTFAYDYTIKSCTLYVPIGSKEAYKDVWKRFKILKEIEF